MRSRGVMDAIDFSHVHNILTARIVHAFREIDDVCCAGRSKSVEFYDLGRLGAGKRERVVLQRQWNTNCVDMRLVHGRLLPGYLKVTVAARFSSPIAGRSCRSDRARFQVRSVYFL